MAEDRTRALLELLIQINREVAAALDLRTVLQRLLFAAMQNVGGERGSIIVMDDTGKAIDATIVYGKTFAILGSWFKGLGGGATVLNPGRVDLPI